MNDKTRIEDNKTHNSRKRTRNVDDLNSFPGTKGVNEATNEIKEQEIIKSPEHDLIFLLKSIKIMFRPETFSKFNNLKYMLYRLGFNYHREKTHINRSELTRRYYFQIQCRLPGQDNEFRVQLTETIKDGDLTEAGMLIENTDIGAFVYMERCIALTGLEYVILNINQDFNTNSSEKGESKPDRIHNLPTTEYENLEITEITEMMKILKWQRLWVN